MTTEALTDAQQEQWKKTPMLTNTRPDFSKVENSYLLDRTGCSCNWLRTDTIFIENEKIKAEIEMKGQRFPVRWACRQKLSDDGSLTLRQTTGLGEDDTTGSVPGGQPGEIQDTR